MFFDFRMAALAAIFVLNFFSAFSQEKFRLSTEFSIKEVNQDETKKLTVGKLYYDINFGKLVLEISFPEKETLVMEDSTIYRIVDGEILDKSTVFEGFVNSTIYHLLLTNKLANFGLKESKYYRETNIERVEKGIVTHWSPLDVLKGKTGKIVTLNESKRLKAIIFYDKDGQVLSKQNFNKYQFISGLNFPTEVVQQYYKKIEDGIFETTKLYNYKNIIINEAFDKDKYDYKLPFSGTVSSSTGNN